MKNDYERTSKQLFKGNVIQPVTTANERLRDKDNLLNRKTVCEKELEAKWTNFT